ncbi:hypothetical protein [Cryobacterium sp. M91]|uniref:hypothetical protein n=1 Tax=Cryobacterium sp. M91 TaxID=2048294 RepID=UPI0011B023F0|nr:hypothetical protein [Cryobacterium sp. M91]
MAQPMAELADLLTRLGTWTTLYIDGPDGSPAPERDARRTSIRDRMLRAGTPEPDVEVALELLTDDGPPAPSSQTILVRDGTVRSSWTSSTPGRGSGRRS